MELPRDIISKILKDKKPVVYGLKGDKVKIIADRNGVLIVEHLKTGQRFSFRP